MALNTLADWGGLNEKMMVLDGIMGDLMGSPSLQEEQREAALIRLDFPPYSGCI